MNVPSSRSGMEKYKQASIQHGVEDATPHRLIQMLMDGVMMKIAAAKGHLVRMETNEKGAAISMAISIIDGLRVSLDFETGGDLARNLDDLYDYMGRCLLQANLKNDAGKLDEVTALMGQIKSACYRIFFFSSCLSR